MRYPISLALAAIVIVSACTNFQEEEVPVSFGVNLSELSYDTASSLRPVVVSSGTKWTVASMPAWMSLQSINPSGRSPYEWTANFMAEANDGYNREGRIVINAKDESAEITVTQDGKKGKYVAVESVSISPSELTLTEGESSTLAYTISPSNASVMDVTWKSSSPSVATVSEAGEVKALAVGTTTITVTSEDGGKTASCFVTVKSKVIPVESVSLDKTSITMTEGDTQTLTETVIPDNATDKSVVWSSNNTSVAVVSSSGVVTANAPGNATITVTTNDGAKKATCSVKVNAATVAVAGVSLNKTSMSLTIGGTEKLTATVTPSNATNKNVTWSSSNTSVATVDSNGNVSAIKVGTAVITVRTEDGGKTATCAVTVNPILVTGVSLNQTSLTMTVGDTETLTATITPTNATDKSIVWSSSNTSVATVSSSGVVTAKAAGSATITVTTNDSGKKATCSITVKEKTISVTGVSLDRTSLSMTEGDAYSLSATVTPSNATNKSLTWSSSNTSVATVSSSGVVSAKVVGTATITVTTNDGGLTATCLINVAYAVPNAIDLGIGVKWGSFNLGAINPEDTGYYYPWGYTAPEAISHLDFIFFTLDSYKWYYSPDRTLTKYCSNAAYGRNGYSDNKTILDKEDDAAYVNLGSQWRIPTQADFKMLQEKCFWEWQTINGVNGYKVTGSNGNSIFLPAVGYGYSTEFRDYGNLGHCWSSSLKTEYPYNAYALKYGSSVIEIESMSRSFLMPIRPVFGESTFVSVTSVSLNKSSLSMTVGNTETLTATIAPSNATDKSVTWSSNNTSVATVSSSGVVTAKAAGSAIITVTTADGGKTATCSVTVQAKTIAVIGISLDKTSLSMTVGDIETLKATITPSNATDKSVKWASNNTSIATVSSSGVVTAKDVGNATITVTTNDGSKEATCNITVRGIPYTASIPDAIDLGLSIKWASFNLGATKPEEFGDSFAWGEVEPKKNYTWETYKWCMGTQDSLTKYCTNKNCGYNGFVDNKTTLTLEDDAAHVILGERWRMPTTEELDELLEKCSFEYSSVNGIECCKVMGPNGNYILFPISNIYNGSREYLTSSLFIYYDTKYSDTNCDGLNFRAYPFKVERYGSLRYERGSIRPVYSE